MSNNLDQILNLKPKVATMPLAAVKLHLGEDTPLAEVQGLTAVISSSAKKDLIKLAGYDDQAIRTFKTNYGDKGAERLLSDSFKKLAHKHVSLAFDGPRITRILLPDQKAAALKPSQIVGLAEFFQSKGMSIHGVQVAPDGTNARVQILNFQRTHETPLLPNEAVQAGYNLDWDAFGGTSIQNFLVRLWCTNGATTTEVRSLNALSNNMDPAEIYKALFNDNAQKFIAKYWERISKLQETPMSIAEFRVIQGMLSAFDKDKDVFKNHFGESNINEMKWMKDYERRGIHINEITKAQAKNAPTPIRWWDAINATTWLASHPNQSGVSEWDATDLMQKAGKLMSKNVDADNWMLDVPRFN